jgi:hypothetical protein
MIDAILMIRNLKLRINKILLKIKVKVSSKMKIIQRNNLILGLEINKVNKEQLILNKIKKM